MVTLEQTRVVNRSLQDCFRYLADFSTIQQWDPGVYRAVKVSPGVPAAGSQYDLILNSAGRKVPMRYQVETLEPPKDGQAKLILTGEGSNFSAYDVIGLTELPNGQCQIHYRADLRFAGSIEKAEAALKPWLNRVGRKAVDGMAAALTPIAPRPLSWSQRCAYKTVLPAAKSFTESGYLQMPNKGLSERMDGKTVVITGPTAGLGLAAAQEMARLGANLVLLGRDLAKLNQACQAIADFAGIAVDSIVTVEADLLNAAAVLAAAEKIKAEAIRIDVLVNNAGALFAERALTADGYERAIAVNLLAPYLLTQALMPQLNPGGHVINVVSGGMYLQPLASQDLHYEQGRYDGSKAYARAKRGLMALTEYWAAQHPELRFNAMHPGWAATPGVAKSLPAFNRKMQKRLRDSAMGADTIVWLASAAAVAKESGKLWFDRQAVPTDVFAKTAVRPDQWQRLHRWLQEASPKAP